MVLYYLERWSPEEEDHFHSIGLHRQELLSLYLQSPLAIRAFAF